jgi:putative restriction endonuclease
MASRRNWNETEVAQAIALYLRLDFGKYHSRNPQVIRLASALDRTPGAVALKLCNPAALDETLPQRGMANASALDRRIWAEFLTDPGRVVAAYVATRDTAPPGFAERRARFEGKQGETRPTTTPTRIGQEFFREMVLTSYGQRCALTGIDDPRLLTASHIVGWAEDVTLRLNPRNGIALNPLHDRAFDRHLITFDLDYRMVIRPDLPETARQKLQQVASDRLTLPARFLPDPAFLDRHRQKFAALAG